MESYTQIMNNSDQFKINCQNIKNNTKEEWEGFFAKENNNKMSLEKKEIILNTKGFVDDYKNSLILGIGGNNINKKSFSFSVYTKDNKVYDYLMKYDEEDKCFYGAYFKYNIIKKKSSFEGYSKITLSNDIKYIKSNLMLKINSLIENNYFSQYYEAIRRNNTSSISTLGSYNTKKIEEVIIDSKNMFNNELENVNKKTLMLKK